MPKITPEDMDAVRDVLNRTYNPFARFPLTSEERDTALASILVRIWDRGYEQGSDDAIDGVRYRTGDPEGCHFTFAHTREWCGYAGCRES